MFSNVFANALSEWDVDYVPFDEILELEIAEGALNGFYEEGEIPVVPEPLPDACPDKDMFCFPLPVANTDYRDEEWVLGPKPKNKREETIELAQLAVEIEDLYEKYGPAVGANLPPVGKYGVHAEVGDDHIAYTNSPLQFLMEMYIAQSYFGVKVSEKDTFISALYGNYSESWILTPQNYSERWISSSVSGGDLPYLDIVKIRTLLPVSQMSQRHSDTLEGKVSLAAKSTIFSTPSTRLENELSIIVQTISLSLLKERKFPFLPDFLGGLGSPVMKGNPLQFCRMVNQFKSGRYGDLIYMIIESINDLHSGDVEQLRFLSRVNEVTHAWRTWYNFFARYVPAVSGQLPDIVNSHMVGHFGSELGPVWDLAADRLKNLKGLVSETDLLVHWRNRLTTVALLNTDTDEDFDSIMSKEREANRSHSIFSNSFRELRNDFLFKDVNRFPTLEEVDYVLKVSSSNTRFLKEGLRSDRLFRPEAMDLIYEDHVLNVDMGLQKADGMPLPLNFTPALDKAQEFYMEQLTEWVLNPHGEPPRWFLEDDDIILRETEDFVFSTRENSPGKTPLVYLETKDLKLAKMVNKTTGMPVKVLMPGTSVNAREAIIKEDLEKYPNVVYRYWDDTGSIEAAAQLSHGPKRKVLIRPFFRTIFPRKLKTQKLWDQSLHNTLFDERGVFPTVKPKRSYKPSYFTSIRRKVVYKFKTS